MSTGSLLSKIIIAPLLLWVAQTFHLVRYASWTQLVGVGVVLALGSMLADATLLPRVGNTSSTVLDFAMVAVIVWVSGMFLAGAATPFFGALITGAIFAVEEWFMHPAIFSDMTDSGRVR